MRIVHAADLHLGHRRYAAITSDFRNQREADVSAAFEHFVTGAIAAEPDLIVLAGDIFDSPRPGNMAMRDAVKGMMRLQRVAPVLAVLGNHDAARVEEGGVGSPLMVLAQVGVKVVTRAEYLRIPSLNATVLCVAEREIRRVALQPNGDPGVHILLAHGAFDAKLYGIPEADTLSPAAIGDQWAYAALGDFHRCTEVAPRAWYSGSLEFVSSDSWCEIGSPKGWLEIDTDTGTVSFHEVPTRPHFDLPVVDAIGLSGKDVTDQILANIAAIEPSGAVVRQVVVDCPHATKSAIDYKTIKAATSSMLAWRPDIRRPEQVGRPSYAVSLPEAPDWLDEFNRDEPVEQFDGVTDAQVNAWLLDPDALRRQAARDPDPYGLDVPKASTMERAA